MFLRASVIALAALASQAPAAEEKATCGTGLICASAPQTVVAALQEAGYKAKLDKDKVGDPMVSSSAAGYTFDIYFYGCEKNEDCTSIQFQTTFVASAHYTPQYVNKWNLDKRFIQMSVNDKKVLLLSYDVATIGGLNQANFTDIVEWWSQMVGEWDKFDSVNKPAAKPPATSA